MPALVLNPLLSLILMAATTVLCVPALNIAVGDGTSPYHVMSAIGWCVYMSGIMPWVFGLVAALRDNRDATIIFNALAILFPPLGVGIVYVANKMDFAFISALLP
jgi:hypothetical protein